MAVTGVSQPAYSRTDFKPLVTAEYVQSLPANTRVLIDARPRWKFVLGHIPGAVNLSDWKEFTIQHDPVPGKINQDKTFIAEKLRPLGIDPHKIIVIYGDLSDKWRSDGRFFWMFEFYGFQRVALLEGGFQGWEEAGFVTQRGWGSNPEPSDLKPSDIGFNWNVLADQTWIADRLNSPHMTLIDNREKHEFDGATPYGSARGGHIPGALHIDWREFFEPNGHLKPQNKLRSLLKSKGILPDREIVVYCTGGVRSAMAYFVFRFLGYKVRNYDGSWWDWSHNPTLPVET